MTTDGIEAVFLETHNWGSAARFFLALGYELEFETDHHSGQLRRGDGPTVFIAEVPPDQEPTTRIVFHAAQPDGLPDAPEVQVVSEFAPTHWGTQIAVVRDPDGRLWNVQAPAGA